MKLFSAVAACMLTAVVMCGGITSFEVKDIPVDPDSDQFILTRHIWGKFWGGGGQQGGGGGPAGMPPSVTAKTFDFKVPAATGSVVGNVPATNAPIACTISAGDPNHSYDAVPNGNSCNIRVTAVGATKLTTSHTDALTLTAQNAAGSGSAPITVRDWALPVITARTFTVTAPVPAISLGTIAVTNGPYTAGVGACGGCDGFFSFDNAGNFKTAAAAAAIASGQSLHQTITASNFAGTASAIININATIAIPVVQALSASIPFPVPVAGTGILQAIASNNPASYTLGGTCTPACTTLFDITLGGLIRIKTASSFTANTTYHPTVNATNAGGTSAAVAQTITVGAQALPAPVMQANTYNHAFPVANNANFGALVATNSPVSFNVASCAGCEGFFTTQGANLIAVIGANFAANTTYHPVVTATNPTGTSPGVAQNVVIGAVAGTPPVVVAGTYPLPFPTSNGFNVGLIATTGGAPTSFNVVGCAPNCTGFFNFPDVPATGILNVANAAAITASTNYTVTVTASNAFGTSAGVDQTVQVSAAPLPAPVVTASTYNDTFPVPANDQIGALVATNAPQLFHVIAGCVPACDGFFTTQGANLVAVTGTNLAASTTYHPVVTATNSSGTSPGVAQNVIVGPCTTCLPPVVSVGNYALTFPVANNTAVGHINATQNPTSYAITGCTPACTGFFNPPNAAGNFTVATGASFAASTVYHPTVTATNIFGTSPGVAQNVTVGAATTPAPVVAPNQVCTTTSNPIEGAFICTLTASNTPTSWVRNSCTGGGCDTVLGQDFIFNTIDPPSSGILRSGGAVVPGNFTNLLNVKACNINGCGIGNITVIQGSGGGGTASPPVVTAQILTVSTPLTAGAKFGQVAATNAPTTYTILGCTGTVSCGGFFQISAEGEISATAAGLANNVLNGNIDKTTFSLTIQASNTGGQGTAVYVINAYADGYPQRTTGTPQNSTYFNTARTLTAVANTVAPNGHNYAINDVLTIAGGSPTCSVAPTVKVTAVGLGGEISGLNLVNAGSCTKIPPNPVYLSGGGGKRAIINAQWSNPTRSYATRPPWMVSGVDYPVGAPQIGRTYKDPATLPLCTVQSSSLPCPTCQDLCRSDVGGGQWWVNIKGNGTILDGYDLSVGPGYWVHAHGPMTNVRISNNKFKVRPDNHLPLMNLDDNNFFGPNNVIQFNTFDFNGVSTDPAKLYIVNGSNSTAKLDFSYNVIVNSWSDWITYGGGSPDAGLPPNGGSMSFHHNYMSMAGIACSACAHADWFAAQSASFDLLSFTFNLFTQPTAGGGTQGIGTGCGNESDNGDTHLYFGNTIFSYNSMGPGPAMNGFFINRMDKQEMNVQNNYVDHTGSVGGVNWIETRTSPTQKCNGALHSTGNIDLVTGGTDNPQ